MIRRANSILRFRSLPLDQPPNQTQEHHVAPDNRGTRDVPFIVKQIPREHPAQEEADGKAKADRDRELTKYTGSLASYTLGLFIATLGLTVATDVPLIYGYFRYRDVAGTHYECGFGFIWLGRQFRPYAEAYNYDRQIEAPVTAIPELE